MKTLPRRSPVLFICSDDNYTFTYNGEVIALGGYYDRQFQLVVGEDFHQFASAMVAYCWLNDAVRTAINNGTPVSFHPRRRKDDQ